MSRKIWSFLLGVMVLACTRLWAEELPQKAPEKVRVMSFNILRDQWRKEGYTYWKDRKDSVIALFEKYDPDVIGLQEETRDQLAFIQKKLPAYIHPNKPHGAGGGILLKKDRWKVIEHGRIPVPGRREASWVRAVFLQDQSEWMLYNIHALHGKKSKPRMDAAKTIAQHMKESNASSVSTVFTGDFNVPDKEPSMQFYYGKEPPSPGLVSAFNVIHGVETKLGTEGWFQDRRSVGRRIDHILMNDKVKALACQIEFEKFNGFYPSDHYPVIADLSHRRKKGISNGHSPEGKAKESEDSK